MSFNIETPPELRGTELQQLGQMRSYLFRLAESLGVAFDNISGSQGATPASSGQVLSAKDFNNLRSMIVNSEKELTSTTIPNEVESQLRRCEESGDFDGNGIDSVVFNDDFSVTFGFTDGTFFKTPPLKGNKGDPGENFTFVVGDVFCTTRSGDAAELVGYGTWEKIATSPVIMWKRTA